VGGADKPLDPLDGLDKVARREVRVELHLDMEHHLVGTERFAPGQAGAAALPEKLGVIFGRKRHAVRIDVRGRVDGRRVLSTRSITVRKMRASRAVLLAAALAVACAAREAYAMGPLDVEIAGQLGGAPSATGDPNPLGVEWGVRAGVSVRRIYVGLAFVSSLGSSATVSCAGPVFNACTETQVLVGARSRRYGVDLGYDFRPLRWLTLRPELGAGDVTFIESSSVEIVENGAPLNLNGSSNTPYLEPGLTALYAFGALLLGFDAGALWLPVQNGASVTVAAHGQAGVRF
jgi:hypothetical protein